MKPSKRPTGKMLSKAGLPLIWDFTKTWVVVCFTGIICLILGIKIVEDSKKAVFLQKRYDNLEDCKIGQSCTFDIVIEEEMKPPIMFYYGLTNFYQNHRVYVRSRSFEQLKAVYMDPEQTGEKVLLKDTTCDPLSTTKVGGVSKDLYPCGLIANSFFTDKFSAELKKKSDGSVVSLCEDCKPPPTGGEWTDEIVSKWKSEKTWSKSDITWSTDKDFFINFDSVPPSATRRSPKIEKMNLPWPEDQDLQVWMRTAKAGDFIKPYRRIHGHTLKPGDVFKVTAHNHFRVDEFDGQKSVALLTPGPLGQGSKALGQIYQAIGVIQLFIVFMMIVVANFNKQGFEYEEILDVT